MLISFFFNKDKKKFFIMSIIIYNGKEEVKLSCKIKYLIAMRENIY